jgi:hypothetical protein
MVDALGSPSGAPPSTSSSTSGVDAVGPTGSTPQGAPIDVLFNLGGARCRTHRQRPLEAAIDVFFNLSGGSAP